MTDPVVNALTMKINYGDEQLRQEIESYIRQVVRNEMFYMTSDPSYLEALIHNNSYSFKQMVLRTIREQFNNTQQIY